MLVAPSILSANFLHLQLELDTLKDAGADYVHIDVMDGHFVPNLTFGMPIIKHIQQACALPLDVHLMVENVEQCINDFLPLQPAFISIHIEAVTHLHRLISHIKAHNISASVALNPHTSEELIRYILPDIDMVLLMSVNPGFSGQCFLPIVLDKARRLKELISAINPRCLLEVDGGVNATNVKSLHDIGVDMVVSGNYIFASSNYANAIQSLKSPNTP